MPLTITTDCPSQEIDGEYAFYNFQGVILTATLDHPECNIVHGTLVYFSNVGEYEQLQPFGDNWTAVDEGTAVGVPLVKATDVEDTWYGKLLVRVAGLEPGSGTTQAYLDLEQRSADLDYTINPVSCVCPAYVDGFGLTFGEEDQSSDFWLDYSEYDQSPDNPGNNYLYYRFQVTDPESHVSLPNMFVRVASSISTPELIKSKQILLYDRYSGAPALNAADEYDNDYVDFQTDENGVAELYLCPTAKTSSIGALTYQIGTNAGGLGPYLIVDPNAQWSTLPSPQTDQPVELNGSTDGWADIPQYKDIAVEQWLFLLCNGRFQSSKRLQQGDVGSAGHIAMPFQKSMLRSETAPFDDATQNAMIYVVYSPVIRVSTNWDFDAVGTPPVASPPVEGNQTLNAPQLRESLDGWPISSALLSNELHIRVPLDQQQIVRGDEIRIHVYLNAYRRGSDEPLGISLGGPFNLYVTQFDIDNGFVEWPFLPQPFWGLGQEQSTGDVGTMRVNYDVVRGTHISIKRIVYGSQDLLLGIDTILPNGYTAEVF